MTGAAFFHPQITFPNRTANSSGSKHTRISTIRTPPYSHSARRTAAVKGSQRSNHESRMPGHVAERRRHVRRVSPEAAAVPLPPHGEGGEKPRAEASGIPSGFSLHRSFLLPPSRSNQDEGSTSQSKSQRSSNPAASSLLALALAPTGCNSHPTTTAAAMAQGGVGGGGGSAGSNHNRRLPTAVEAAMALRGGGGLAGINRYRQPAAVAHRGVGAGVGAAGAGIDHNLLFHLRPSYYPPYRDLYQLAPPAPAVAAAADNAGSLSDIEDEDPPLDVPAANNPPRVVAAAAAAPPLTDDAPGAGLGIRCVDIAARDARRRRAEPSEDDDEGSNRRRQRQAEDEEASSEAAVVSPEEIYEALKEIPDLARADLLRAYSKLTRDARQFRCLMALPNDMRKDWLLMEIGSQ